MSAERYYKAADLSARLRKLREGQRPIKSMSTVSELCGLEKGAVRRYERGERQPTIEALVALADYYNVTLDYLLGREYAGDDKKNV